MDTALAFAMGKASRGNPLMIFDWNKAARLIRERNAKVASAGLQGDWEYTGDCILRDGKPAEDSYTYLASTWATPQLEIDGEVIDCYVMESEANGWDANTYWPDEALAILNQQ